MKEESKIKSIILLDDNSVTNFIHKKIIDDLNLDYCVNTYTSANTLLDEIKSTTNPEPSYYFIDLNMPYMNAWEFLEKYNDIPIIHKNKKSVFLLLTTSLLDEEIKRADNHPLIKKIILKPLTVNTINTFLF